MLTFVGYGSDYDNSGVESAIRRRMKRCSRRLKFFQAPFDPTYTFTVPLDQTAPGSADIISHTFEQYLVGKRAITDAMCEGVLRTVFEHAPKAIDEAP